MEVCILLEREGGGGDIEVKVMETSHTYEQLKLDPDIQVCCCKSGPKHL